jgi:NAD(P)-dependent dehydrogenase (short-subunit alcohol dehydrogenase family)
VICSRAVLPVMMKQQGGHIINLSSVAAQKVGHEPMTGLAYDVSKAAMNRFTLGLARELLPHGIAVNALMPDNTKTEGWSYLNPSVDNENWMEPEQWGRHAVVVASQDPASFTGKILSHEMLVKLSNL